ncbi:hypothetical protein [Saccharothrix coeruleofusca]|uniref:Uncharacterized protein n=1 Tax=Saccharothrix coeruleofusca TaxID=33919 RepID=A0A918EH45_9PSEU|nr:hypothetical protein [Saccharothrix coeruleofusca]MBP2335945.1 hypothetical protein [Saccharothrix coeruleofusca]GGP76437.1 hypothetical protein GCM10010185_57700 [Saccharothrix coeruleofusca]
MKAYDLRVVDLADELNAARDEQRLHVARGDTRTAELLSAWIDALLDEWNRRRA